MVGIGKASTRPAKVRNLQLSQRVHDVLPHAVNVGDVLIVVSNIKSSINAPAQVLGEVSVDVTAYGDSRVGGLHGDA
jgi:hypothetical protein